MHILIAPNAFKHSLNANAASKAIEAGLLRSKLKCSSECFPIGDGGNGTCELILAKCGGNLIPFRAKDGLGRTIDSSYGLIDEGLTAVIEMANASGLHLLKINELNPLYTSSYGTGQMLSDALEKGVRKIIIGMGGTATVDGGSGILQALGVKFLDDKGQVISNLPIGLEKLDSIDYSGLDKRINECQIIILCDVDNPLLGENGAAAVFAPQKGATPEMVEKLETVLEQYAKVIHAETGIDISKIRSGGVAGGASAGLHAFLGAKLVNGIDYFLDLTGFDDALKRSDLVITGEGSIDEQTLQGKGPFGVAKRAKLLDIPVIGLAGKVPVENNIRLQAYFDVLTAIGNEPAPLEEALFTTAKNLSRVSSQMGNLIARFSK